MTAKTESLMAADNNYCLIVSRFQYQRKINVHLKDPSNLEFTFNIPNGTISAPWGGGGALPIMDYTWRLCPNEVPFSGWRYIKG